MADPKSKVQEQRLLADFDTYDQHVDVVSAFEWVFTDPLVQKMPSTVRHFERFPRVKSAAGAGLTPDFTVLFLDGTGIVGEIAKIALRDESIDGLLDQIGKYAEMTQLPDGTGHLVDVSHLDVLLILEMRSGLAAFRRIIEERYFNSDHPYKPPRPPCLVQFARTDTVYAFQRIPDPRNGSLASGDRDPHIQHYLDEGFNPRIERFANVKVNRGFINDQIDPLYLATHLWTRTWPTQHGAATEDITVHVSPTAEILRAQYGVVRARDVKRALELLGQVGLAAKEQDGTWLVSRQQLGRSGSRDVHKLIAARFSGNPRRLVTRRARPSDASPPMETLFDV